MNVSGNNDIVMLSGTMFNCTATLTPKAATRLVGSHQLYTSVRSTADPIISWSDKDDIIVENIKFNGLDKSVSGMVIAGTAGVYSERPQLHNVYFINCNFALTVSFARCGDFSNVRLACSNTGLYIPDYVVNTNFYRLDCDIMATKGIRIEAATQRCEGLTFTDSFIVSCTQSLYFGDGDEISFNKCVFDMPAATAHFFIAGGNRITFDKCYIAGTGVANAYAVVYPEVAAITNLTFDNCKFYGNQAYGLRIYNNGATRPSNIIIDKCDFSGNGVGGAGLDLWIDDVDTARIRDNIFSSTLVQYNYAEAGAPTDIKLSGDKFAISTLNLVEGASTFDKNTGYIDRGEVRTVRGSLAGGAANVINFAWHNPEAQDIYVKKVVITLTAADADAPNIDCGIADDATYTNGGTEFFDDLPGETIAVDDSWLAGDGGKQTKWVLCQDSASATDGWVVAKILTNDGTSIAGSWYVEYVGK